MGVVCFASQSASQREMNRNELVWKKDTESSSKGSALERDTCSVNWVTTIGCMSICLPSKERHPQQQHC